MSAPSTTDTKPGGTRTGRPLDPLGELAFKVQIQGMTIGRFAECAGLAVEYDVTEYAEGGNNGFVHHLRGAIRFPNVTLRRGVTHEDLLLRWFYETRKPEKRPLVTITLFDPRGQAIRHFALTGALPVRWTGPTATSASRGAATESLEIAHQGFV
jgi:phage tail-like protein